MPSKCGLGCSDGNTKAVLYTPPPILVRLPRLQKFWWNPPGLQKFQLDSGELQERLTENSKNKPMGVLFWTNLEYLCVFVYVFGTNWSIWLQLAMYLCGFGYVFGAFEHIWTDGTFGLNWLCIWAHLNI